jgi:hypothetical protein
MDGKTISRLGQIEQEIRALPGTIGPNSFFCQFDLAAMAGSLIAETIDLGLFNDPDHAKLRSLVAYAKSKGGNWQVGAWDEAVHCLTPKHDWEAACGPIADYIHDELAKIKPARKPKKAPVLTASQQEVFDCIKEYGPIMGREITNKTGTDESTITKHIIPVLKKLGVKNRRGAGYYLSESEA